jgi:hypothetical protein
MLLLLFLQLFVEWGRVSRGRHLHEPSRAFPDPVSSRNPKLLVRWGWTGTRDFSTGGSAETTENQANRRITETEDHHFILVSSQQA